MLDATDESLLADVGIDVTFVLVVVLPLVAAALAASACLFCSNALAAFSLASANNSSKLLISLCAASIAV